MKNETIDDTNKFTLEPLLLRTDQAADDRLIQREDLATSINPLPWVVHEDLSSSLSHGKTNYTRVRMETTDDT